MSSAIDYSQPVSRRYFLKAAPALLYGCASAIRSGGSNESNSLGLFKLAQEQSMEIKHSPSAGIVTHVARYIDPSNYNQKKNAGVLLTQQDIYVTIEATLSDETGALVSLKIDAGHNGKLFDAGVDGIHHPIEEGYVLPVGGSGDSVSIPQSNGKGDI